MEVLYLCLFTVRKPAIWNEHDERHVDHIGDEIHGHQDGCGEGAMH
jgi:hypothetical protein